MSIPSQLLTTTCDIYRPFTAPSPTATGVACRMVSGFLRSRVGPTGLNWSHYIDVSDTVDIRDGCGRGSNSDALGFADGDAVRVPTGAGSTRYVVVWVDVLNRGTAQQFKRAYLLRDAPAWPGP